MACVYKRKEDKKDRTAPWRFSYKGADGRRTYGTGYRDKAETERLANKLEDEARLCRIDPRQARATSALSCPIDTHFEDFERHLQGKGNTSKHVRLALTRVKAALGGVRTLGGIVRSDVAAWIASQIGPRRKPGSKDPVRIGPRTANHYAQVLEEFGRWLVEDNRLHSNPFTGLPRWNTEIDVRHARRALSGTELQLLLETARTSPRSVQCFSGEARYRVYRVACCTGLRKSEIASLTPDSFDLEGNPPTLTIDAACSKHRRQDVLPIHPGLAAELPGWMEGLGIDDHLFPGLERKKTFRMVQADLKAAGIPYDDGGFMDFHGLRHSFVTNLLRAGASITEARDLARHSDIRMTARYAQLTIDDQAAALNKLQFAQHGRNTDVGRDGRECAGMYTDTAGDGKATKRQTPGNTPGICAIRLGCAETGGNGEKWRRRESNPKRRSA